MLDNQDVIEAWLRFTVVSAARRNRRSYECTRTVARSPCDSSDVIRDARFAGLCPANGVDVLLIRERDFSLSPELLFAA
jgi:hypothetical protein